MGKRNGTQIPLMKGLFINVTASSKKGKCRCQTPHLTEAEIKEKFIEAYNLTMEDKERITNDLKEVINLLTDTTELEKRNRTNKCRTLVVVELAAKTIKENSKSNEDSVDYEK